MPTDGSGKTPTADDLVTLNRAATVARLLAGVAHEVNNALQVIGGTAEMLEDQVGNAAATATGLVRIRTQSARAASALTEVLTFAREQPGVRGVVNVREIASRAVSLRAYAIGRARLTVDFVAPETGRYTVEGNRGLVQQAILNLIGNAEQMLAGRPGGTIRVELLAEGGSVIVRVADTGPGVPAAERARIFEPFVTTHPTTDATGLGLAAARHIAEAHGGTLTLEATGAGASFALRLPAA